MSGHIFYKDGFYGHDDALYVAVRLLDILARQPLTMSGSRMPCPLACNTPEIRFDCPEERKFQVIGEVRSNLAAEGADVDGIDGVRVKTPDGWWLARASNTQAVLVVRAEASSPEGLDRLKATVREQLGRVGVAAPAGFPSRRSVRLGCCRLPWTGAAVPAWPPPVRRRHPPGFPSPAPRARPANAGRPRPG